MSELLVIVPSRGRPTNITRLADAFSATTDGCAELLVALDDDDPRRDDYPTAENVTYTVGPRLRMAGTLNAAAVEQAPFYRHLGFMGDDHLPRTVGWDRTICQELDTLGTGLAYGNDLVHGAGLPTAVFLTSDIVRTLGWMALPGAWHLFLDNAWKALGEHLSALSYLPDVIIEHIHPVVGKAGWDAGYTEVNGDAVWEHDRAVYEAWVAEGLERDTAKLRHAHG